MSIISCMAQDRSKHILSRDEVTWTDEKTITQYTGPVYVGQFIIPEELGIETIGEMCFYGEKTLNASSVYIPSTVREIQDMAFCDFISDTLIIAEGTISIGEMAFNQTLYRRKTPNTVTHISLPSTLKYIGAGAFGCTIKTDTLVIPPNVEIIDKDAFEECKIRILILNEGLKRIGINAFVNNLIEEVSFPSTITYLSGFMCNSLRKVSIPSSVKTIGFMAFMSNPIETIEIAEGVEKIDPCAFDNETGFIPDYWRSRFTEIVIPNSVKEIGKRAFNKCDKLQKVTLSSNLKSIGDSAFRKTGISEVIIPNSVETIGSVAFFECKNLKKIQLSQNLTQLGRQAFCRCDIREIDIPSSLSQIPFEAFRDNQNTDKITLHNGLEYIGERAFSYCYGITLTELPQTLRHVAPSAFYSTTFACRTLPLPKLPQSLEWKSYEDTESNIVANAYYLGYDYNYGQNVVNQYGYKAYPTGLPDLPEEKLTTKIIGQHATENIEIWTIDGQKIYSGNTLPTDLKHGLYIVKRNNKTQLIRE